MAEKAGISPVFLSQIENNRKIPSLETIYNIALSLGVTIDCLFHKKESRSRNIESQIERLLSGRTDEEKALIYEIVEFALSIIEKGS